MESQKTYSQSGTIVHDRKQGHDPYLVHPYAFSIKCKAIAILNKGSSGFECKIA